MMKNIPVNIPIYLAQQPKVQIPLPQQSPIRAMTKIGKIIISVKFLICILHPNKIKHGS